MHHPAHAPPSAEDLAREASCQALRAVHLLERWLALHEQPPPDADTPAHPPDLKEFTLYATALERTLRIARLAEALATPQVTPDQPIHADLLRQFLQEATQHEDET